MQGIPDITMQSLPSFSPPVGRLLQRLETIYHQYRRLAGEERELLDQLAQQGYAYEEQLPDYRCI